MNINLRKLNKNMKLLRTVKKFSQEELADTIHLARSTYSTYETGAKIPDLQTLDALAALYDIGFDSLVNYDLSEGLLHRIYFSNKDERLIELLNNYQALSIASKNLVTERMDVLLEREGIFYNEYARPRKNEIKFHYNTVSADTPELESLSEHQKASDRKTPSDAPDGLDAQGKLNGSGVLDALTMPDERNTADMPDRVDTQSLLDGADAQGKLAGSEALDGLKAPVEKNEADGPDASDELKAPENGDDAAVKHNE